MFYRTVIVLLSVSVLNYVKCDPRVAEANLQAGIINGTIYFTETDNGVQVTGAIFGLQAGLYGFHVHEIGDVSTCDAAGPHFNPTENNHGGRDHLTRHVGDLGNVAFVSIIPGLPGIASVNFTDNIIALSGTNNIVGRTLVLHEQEDDLGLGGHETSLTTGNAGPRVACGIIREVDSGNSVGSITPSLMVFSLTAALMYISL